MGKFGKSSSSALSGFLAVVFGLAIASMVLPGVAIAAEPNHLQNMVLMAADESSQCPHEWCLDDEESVEPTFLEKGRNVWYCEICGATKSKRVPKLKKTQEDKKAIKAIKTLYKYAKTYNSQKMLSCFKSKPSSCVFTSNKTSAQEIIRK